MQSYTSHPVGNKAILDTPTYQTINCIAALLGMIKRHTARYGGVTFDVLRDTVYHYATRQELINAIKVLVNLGLVNPMNEFLVYRYPHPALTPVLNPVTGKSVNLNIDL